MLRGDTSVESSRDARLPSSAREHSARHKGDAGRRSEQDEGGTATVAAAEERRGGLALVPRGIGAWQRASIVYESNNAQSRPRPTEPMGVVQLLERAVLKIVLANEVEATLEAALIDH